MANLIKLKRTNTAAAVPSLVYGEIGWNSADSKLYVGSFANASVQVGGSSLVVGVDVQAYDAGLQSLAGIATTGADRLIYATATDVYTTSAFTAFGRSLVDDVDASASRTTLGLVIGTNVQAYDAKLTTLAGLAVTDNAVIIGNGTTFVVESGATLKTSLGLTIGTNIQAYSSNLTDIAALAHSYQGFLVSDGFNWTINTPTQVRTALALTVGTNVQAYDAGLQSIAAKTTAADSFLYTTANDVYVVGTITAFGRSLVDDASAAAGRTTLEIGKVASTLAGGRLTLLTGVGVPTSDQIGGATLYYTPFAHGMIGLYDGTDWIPREFTQRSLIFGGMTSGKNYDVFIGDTAGTLAIEILAWTSDSVRATALLAVDGVLVKTSDTSRRYVGTFRATSATTTEDSQEKRFVYNANNKVPRAMLGTLGYLDDNASQSFTHLGTLNTYSALNGGTGSKCEWINGLSETVFLAGSMFFATGASPASLIVGMGIDTTTGASFIVAQSDTGGATAFTRGCSKSVSFAAGYHYSSLNAYTTNASNSSTVYRDDARQGGTVDPLRTFISGSITS